MVYLIMAGFKDHESILEFRGSVIGLHYICIDSLHPERILINQSKAAAIECDAETHAHLDRPAPIGLAEGARLV